MLAERGWISLVEWMNSLALMLIHVVNTFGMIPHPEGGWYAEMFRSEAAAGERPAVSAIYFLLREGERSHWHAVDATEIWLWHAGSPIRLHLSRRGCGPGERGVGHGSCRRSAPPGCRAGGCLAGGGEHWRAGAWSPVSWLRRSTSPGSPWHRQDWTPQPKSLAGEGSTYFKFSLSSLASRAPARAICAWATDADWV